MIDELYFPITLLPGLGMLILSTSNLSMTLSGELSDLIHEDYPNKGIIEKKIVQLGRLNRALTLFYISCSMLVVMGLFNGLGKGLALSMQTVSDILLFLSISCILLALTLLMIYAARAVGIKRQQFREQI